MALVIKSQDPPWHYTGALAYSLLDDTFWLPSSDTVNPIFMVCDFDYPSNEMWSVYAVEQNMFSQLKGRPLTHVVQLAISAHADKLQDDHRTLSDFVVPAVLSWMVANGYERRNPSSAKTLIGKFPVMEHQLSFKFDEDK